MRTWNINLGVFAMVVAMVCAGQVRANMGCVWAEEVGQNSIKIKWTDPSVIHRSATGVPYYEVCVEAVHPYSNSYPSSSASLCKVFSGISERVHVISDLAPGTYYRIRVMTRAEKRDTYGRWINSFERQIGTIKQKTFPETPGHHLRLAGAGHESLSVEFSDVVPKHFDVIRFIYKAKWSQERLMELGADATRLEEEWKESDGRRGWVDVPFDPVLRVTFRSMEVDQAYEVAAFGFNIGPVPGEKLGSVAGKTSGYDSPNNLETLLALDHHDILKSYAHALTSTYGGPDILSRVREMCEDLTQEVDFVKSEEGDDLNDDLTALLYLILARPEIFDCWQAKEPESPPLSLAAYVKKAYPRLFEALQAEISTVPPLFRRGDSNASGEINLADVSRLFSFLFLGGRMLSCEDAGDCNDDGEIDVSDPIHILNFLFLGGVAPAGPPEACSTDDTEDKLGCEEFNNCRA